MQRKLIHWFGLTGVIALLSYTAAVVFAPLAFPGYNPLAQAVSDLSAESAPSRLLWNQLAAFYNVCSVVCPSVAAIFAAQERISNRLWRTGIYLFALMNWISCVGYTMFPLDDSGKAITSFQEVGHMAVTALVVLLSIASLVMLIIAGFQREGIKSFGIWALAALVMMLIGAMGQRLVPPDYFGVIERFSVFSAVGFNAVTGIYLFNGFRCRERKKHA